MKHKSKRNKSAALGRRKNRGTRDTTYPVEHDEVKDATTDLSGMKQWIESLTFDSLVNALEFSFKADADDVSGGQQQHSGSREYDLMMEMLSLQRPENNCIGLGDMENYYQLRRYSKATLETPCLFRWVIDSKAEKTKQSEPTPDISSDDLPLASLAMGDLPSELLDVLAKAGVKRSTSALLETFNEVDEIDKAFESLEDCQHNMTKKINVVEDPPPFPANFRVKADRWIADDGTSLGKGTTIEQQKADSQMLRWTSLVWDRTLGGDNPEKKVEDLSIRNLLPRCTFRGAVADSSTRNEKQCKRLILDTLRVASRGKFLSKAGKQRHPYLAPWFDPTEHWFSLSVYLASRFEASLWGAYLERGATTQISDEAKESSLVNSVKSLYDGDAIDRVFCYAICVVIRDVISQQQDSITMGQLSSAESIRSTLLWKLLLCENGSNMMARQIPDKFASIPLLELNTPSSELKLRVMDHLLEGLALEAERSLIQSVSAGCNQKSKVIKKKKKHPKKKGGLHLVTKSIHAQIEEEQKSGDDDDGDEEDEPHVECILPNSPPAETFGNTTTSDSSPRSEQNSAKMTVLKVLDDILNNVFTRLGVQDDEFSDFTDAMTVKSRGETLRREIKNDDDNKIHNTDDIEVATTAVVSNKAGPGVEAAMSLLQRTDQDINHLQSSPKSQQLWASRSRRQSLAGTISEQNDSLHLKRSMSSGDGSMVEQKKPPASKSCRPTPHDDMLVWPMPSGSPVCPQARNVFDGAPLCLSGALDGWNSVACKEQNEENIFTDLLKKEQGDDNIASSTVASIASSRGNIDDAGLDIDGDFVDSSPEEKDGGVVLEANESGSKAADVALPKQRVDSPSESPPSNDLSPPPSAPPTPPPRVSPILVSLADLGKLREEAASIELKEKVEGLPKPVPLNSIPKKPRTLTPSLSRDDLRSIDECWKPPRRDRDDHHTKGHRQVDALLSYRNVVAQSVPRKPPSLKSYDGKQKHRDDAPPILARSTRSTKTGIWPPGHEFPSLSSSVTSMSSYREPILNKVLHLDVACARSEGGLDGADDASHCNVIPRAQTDDTMTKDGTTTISSVHSPPETEQVGTLKEERDAYRDICLTLGAENAKLRNLLASATCVATCAPLHHPTYYRNDQQFWPPNNSVPNQFSTRSIVAMSDAGAHRGDYESLAMSEDGTDVHPSVVAIGIGEIQNTWQAMGDSVQSFSRRQSGGGTYAGSDTSLEQNVGQGSQGLSDFRRGHHQDSFFGPIPLHGMQSRLSKDISLYMQHLKGQLKKNEPRRLRARKQLEQSVKALWPRAQIIMYGSHVTKLCLPSSDVDFVISLPAVHKNAPATTPGDLEGRNAIVETNQKVLARKLKGESWLDQRSIKVIERTAVPVIKVSTKDSRSRVVQLDLSFDAKEHHGLEALNMIRHILEQLPMVRPLVLVLKQFLLDRGLLTAYTGGLSSYCLFLMVARYCQEQAPTWNDCGSLLMGLLDFYGNFFDPRTTGISVRTRQYFFRSQDAQQMQQNFPEAQGWNTPHQFPDLTKRNSFTSKPHRFQPLHRQFSFQSTQTNASQSQQFKSARFDPMWVEDPLNPGNNVGRNAFRIFQVQRAFSDSHRALMASLEWDINSTSEFGDDGEYPLLKCLLQNEDVFIAIDEPIHR